MKRFLAFILLFCVACTARAQDGQFSAYDFEGGLAGSAASNMIGIVKLHYSYWLDARNSRLIEEAEDEIAKTLRPGQTVNVYVIVSGPKKSPIFQRIIRESDGDMRNGNEWILRRDTIYWTRSPYCSATPLDFPIASRSEFEGSIRRSFSSRVTYDDYVFLMNAVKKMIQVREIRYTYMYDFEDDTALAGVNGTVILTSEDSASTYRVYDAANNRSDPHAYRKGSALSRMGNTVWVLCRSNVGEYVLVYNDLERINVSVGERVQAGSTRIGQWQDASRRDISLYRVFGPKQYFLRSDGYPEPYPVFMRQ